MPKHHRLPLLLREPSTCVRPLEHDHVQARLPIRVRAAVRAAYRASSATGGIRRGEHARFDVSPKRTLLRFRHANDSHTQSVITKTMRSTLRLLKVDRLLRRRYPSRAPKAQDFERRASRLPRYKTQVTNRVLVANLCVCSGSMTPYGP